MKIHHITALALLTPMPVTVKRLDIPLLRLSAHILNALFSKAAHHATAPETAPVPAL